MHAWRKLGETVVYERFRRILSRRFALPDGREADFEVYDDPDSVVVLALTPANEVVLAREFRPGPEEILLGLPGGLIEDGETPAHAAAKELLEETGYAGDLRPVATVLTSAYSTRSKHIFAATAARPLQEPDPRELTEPVLVPLTEFRAHLRSGRLTDLDAGYLVLEALNLL